MFVSLPYLQQQWAFVNTKLKQKVKKIAKFPKLGNIISFSDKKQVVNTLNNFQIFPVIPD